MGSCDKRKVSFFSVSLLLTNPRPPPSSCDKSVEFYKRTRCRLDKDSQVQGQYLFYYCDGNRIVSAKCTGEIHDALEATCPSCAFVALDYGFTRRLARAKRGDDSSDRYKPFTTLTDSRAAIYNYRAASRLLRLACKRHNYAAGKLHGLRNVIRGYKCRLKAALR